MDETLELYLDACVLIHSIMDRESLPPEQGGLGQEIEAIAAIRDMARAGKVSISRDLQVDFEMRFTSDERAKFKAFWCGCKFDQPSPVLDSTKVCLANALPGQAERQAQHEALKRMLDDPEGHDSVNVLNAEWFAATHFVTTDGKLVNKAKNVQSWPLKIRVMLPTTFVAEAKASGLLD